MPNANMKVRSRWSRFAQACREAVTAASRKKARVIGVLVFVAHVLGVVSSVHAIMTARTDLDRSVPFDASRLKEMPFYKRFAVRAARLLSPIL